MQMYFYSYLFPILHGTILVFGDTWHPAPGEISEPLCLRVSRSFYRRYEGFQKIRAPIPREDSTECRLSRNLECMRLEQCCQSNASHRHDLARRTNVFLL